MLLNAKMQNARVKAFTVSELPLPTTQINAYLSKFVSATFIEIRSKIIKWTQEEWS